MITSVTDLMERVNNDESEMLEFKENYDNETIETAGSFANTRGGIILIGVRSKGTITGTTITSETLKDWANQISQVSEPTLIPDVQPMDIEGDTVVIISIKEYPLKPVAIRGRCYRRVGNSNRVMTPAEISEMHLQSMGTTWDATPCPNATLKDIESNIVNEYVSRTKNTGRRHFRDDENVPSLLEKLDIVHNNTPTWAAVLAFGKRPPMQAKVKCGKIRGTSTIVDDFVVDVPIIDQVEEVMEYMRRVLTLSYSISGKAKRDEIWEYPLDAVREVVTNAVCHRDYSSPAQIQLKIFDDRLVIWNPGGLPFGMSIERLMDPNHNSIPRNKLIAMIFYDTGLIENYGSGIQRIFDKCHELGFPEPVFKELDGGFQVTFHKDIYNDEYLANLGLNGRQIKAILYVKEKGKITNMVYQSINNVSKRTATRDLDELITKALIVQIGKTGKGTHYKIKQRGQRGHKGVIKGSNEVESGESSTDQVEGYK
jgi:ATP-dependent DNA helicase RecG